MAGALETRLAELFILIEGATSATCLRNRAVPSEIPADGLVIMYDGQPGEPEVLLSPLSYHYDHRVQIDVMVQDAATREADADAIRTAIGEAIEADRTLGDTCDWVEMALNRTDDSHVFGGKTIRADLLVVTLSYATSNPLT